MKKRIALQIQIKRINVIVEEQTFNSFKNRRSFKLLVCIVDS